MFNAYHGTRENQRIIVFGQNLCIVYSLRGFIRPVGDVDALSIKALIQISCGLFQNSPEKLGFEIPVPNSTT